MTSARKSTPPEKKNVTTISGDVVDSVIVTGDNNQTIIQKFFNIFKSDSETLEQRNRRILLNHVENAWIKGVLDASLHGAALLDLGIKPDPEAVTKYPWAIKKESTDETLPAGTSMLEIFDSIGMGRSLLILGAPGSGKTTMLLELARQLIARAREDVTQPIPMVFNLASWKEKFSLADWLAQELNNLYSVPRKTAPDWVKGDKLLLLLDGLDEVRQESRARCVEAINEFRKQNGLTSLAVCSRTQDYADINAKLSFEGAIEVQLLTQKQITEFFNRFGDEMAGIKQALGNDNGLREMAETPLFLSIMLMAYRDKREVEILVSGDEKAQRKHLVDTYLERMFERRTETTVFRMQDVLHWLSWLASKMNELNAVPYLLERMQPHWLGQEMQLTKYKWLVRLGGGLIFGLFSGLVSGLFGGLFVGIAFATNIPSGKDIQTVDALTWRWEGLIHGLLSGLLAFVGLFVWLNARQNVALFFGLFFGLLGGLLGGLETKQIDQTTRPGEKIALTTRNFLFVTLTIFLLFGLSFGLFASLIFGLSIELFVLLFIALLVGLSFGLSIGINYGGWTLIQHYTLRFLMSRNNFLPQKVDDLVPFLDHCVDLIFLRRVGGGYIFIHRLLMEHFAEMYVETPTSKGN